MVSFCYQKRNSFLCHQTFFYMFLIFFYVLFIYDLYYLDLDLDFESKELYIIFGKVKFWRNMAIGAIRANLNVILILTI